MHTLLVGNEHVTTTSTKSRNSPKGDENIGPYKELNTNVLSSFIHSSPKLNRTHMYISRSWVKLCYSHTIHIISMYCTMTIYTISL